MSCEIPEPEKTQIEKKELNLPEGVPPLGSFYLYLTTGCNLCCRHCWINPVFEKGVPSPGEYIDFKLLKDAVKTGKTLGLSNAKLTGGEPLLHPQFIDIVDFFHEQKIPLTMETNGTLIDKETAIHLKKNSSLWHISVSLDSPRADYHDWFRGVKGAFEKAVQGIKHLVTAGFHPQIIMCPHKGNLHEIDDLVKLAVDLGAGSVKFNPINGVGRGKTFQEKGDSLNFDETMNLVHYINNDLQQKTPIKLISLLPPALHSIKELLVMGRHSGTCRVINILGILGSGEMALCGIGQTIPDLCFGTLGKNDLRDVWINHPRLKELREGLTGEFPGICGDCIHSSTCFMHCVAQNYIENGKLLSPDSMCMETEKRGLFPDSRRRFNTQKADTKINSI
ncbi:MAG: radical SAM protein [Desulfobacteraceae bacterium]|nr:radical SAM protein [Desulfobacteraceae bacterium]